MYDNRAVNSSQYLTGSLFQLSVLFWGVIRYPAVRLIISITAYLFISNCSEFPRDARNTLENIQKEGVLQVGVIENPPWVIRRESVAAGLEPDIIHRLARELGVEVRWHWGTTGELIHALELYQLDLVVGGLVMDPRLPKTVAASKPYYVTRYTVGFPPAFQSIPVGLENLSIAVPQISPIHEALRKERANPYLTIDAEGESNVPIAGPDWRLEAQGYTPGPWTLLRQRHVMLLAKGENAWLLTLQRHLNQLTRVDENLRTVEGQR